ncbi:MAG TPA: site-2 protease family protein [Thermoplasmata archaeon]|nr:site-2 protease family protein [Thermoplasmata archaeon]
MDPYLDYEIALAVVVLYALVVYALYKSGRLGPDKPLSLFGPALMIKTQRGRSALDRWGRFKRFWTVISDIGIGLSVLAMGTIVGLLVFGAIESFRLTAATAPPVSEAVGLPGINPIIPIGYGIVALVVGIVLHELSHGVVARSQNIGVKSLGILWCVVPVGAFVEQDDTEMLAASRRRRDRVAAAGVLANFALTVLFFALLSGMIASSVTPNADGVGVGYVQPSSPAANLSLSAGDIITSINGTPTTTASQFESALQNSTPGETIPLVYYSANLGQTVTTHVVLATNPNVKTRGFLGVAVTVLSPTQLKQSLVWPLGSDQGPIAGGVYWLILPLGGLEPVSGSTTNFFHLSGPLAGLGTANFWIAANILYWLAWMNLLLGLSNALPLFPLDGGLLFRDFSASVAARFRRGWSAARLDEFGGRAVTVSSVLVLTLLVWQFLVPRLL